MWINGPCLLGQTAMLKETKVTIGNVCFISNGDNSKVLLLKRNRHPMKNLYTGVGGKTHFNEDIHLSCIREIKEETGLEISEIELKGVLKTILADHQSSWILFVYIARTWEENLQECDEGKLEWIDKESVADCNLIGFIREIIASVLSGDQFLEGTIFHDIEGNVIEKNLTVASFK